MGEPIDSPDTIHAATDARNKPKTWPPTTLEAWRTFPSDIPDRLGHARSALTAVCLTWHEHAIIDESFVNDAPDPFGTLLKAFLRRKDIFFSSSTTLNTT